MLHYIAIIQLQVQVTKLPINAISFSEFLLFSAHYIENAEFIRKQYVHLNWFNSAGHKLTDGSQPYIQITDLDVYCELNMNRAGPFHFYFTYQNAASDQHQGSLYVQVEPILTVGQSKLIRHIPLDSIRCQTVMSKCLGALSTWETKLIVAKNAEYNMIHFTPIQELGGSRSGYSLKDQLKVNPDFGERKNSLLGGKKSTGSVVSFDELDKVIKKMKNDWGVSFKFCFSFSYMSVAKSLTPFSLRLHQFVTLY